MPTKEVILSFLYMLPVIVLLDKNKLKASLFLFVFLMTPVFLKIYMDSFEFFALAQLACWIISIIAVKFFQLLYK